MANSGRLRLVLILLVSAILSIVFVGSFRNQVLRDNDAPEVPVRAVRSQASLNGHAIAPKLGNETLKAELGNAAWKLLHTVMARFPDVPTPDESEALKSYVYLFQRLYPCGECADHFGTILARYPPQVSSRSAAAAWACHVHNVVNESLEKGIFDCSKIGDFYDCGCAEDVKGSMNAIGATKHERD